MHVNQVTEEEEAELRERTTIQSMLFGEKELRITTHLQVTREDTERAARKFQYVLREVNAKLSNGGQCEA